jgi:hypothetical protein
LLIARSNNNNNKLIFQYLQEQLIRAERERILQAARGGEQKAGKAKSRSRED